MEITSEELVIPETYSLKGFLDILNWKHNSRYYRIPKTW